MASLPDSDFTGTGRNIFPTCLVVRELMEGKAEQKRDWALTREALLRLLDWLDEGTDSEGQNYLKNVRNSENENPRFSWLF